MDEFDIVAKEWLNGHGGPGSREFIDQLQGVDAVVFNAEGSTYRNNYSAILGLFMLWLARTKFEIPSFFVNGSVTLTTVDPILLAIVNKVFSVLDGVSSPYDATSLWSNMDTINQGTIKLIENSFSKREKLKDIAKELGKQTLDMGFLVQPYLNDSKCKCLGSSTAF